MQKNDFEKALNLAYFFLKFRPRTIREVEVYLQRRTQKYRFSPDVIPTVIQKLQEDDYLNDKKFVEMYIHDRLRFKPRSSFMLRQELERRGVSKDIVASFFELNPAEDQSTAVSLLQKRMHIFTRLPSKERFLKAIRYLKGKGFSYGDSVSAYNALEGRVKNSFEDSSPTE